MLKLRFEVTMQCESSNAVRPDCSTTSTDSKENLTYEVNEKAKKNLMRV